MQTKHRLCHGCLQRAQEGREAPRFVGIQGQNSAVIRADDRSVRTIDPARTIDLSGDDSSSGRSSSAGEQAMVGSFPRSV